jgi:hypothetical protein
MGTMRRSAWGTGLAFLPLATFAVVAGCGSSNSAQPGLHGEMDASAAADTTRDGSGSSSGATSSSGGTSGSGSGGSDDSGGTGDGSSGAGGEAGGPVALVNPAPASKFFVGANFWNIDWEGQADFFQSGVDFTTVTNPWVPQFLSDLAPYAVLRFMDWNETNTSNNPQASWATRKQKTQPQNEPVAFEWQIDLCNRTKKDYWLNIPHESTADVWQKLAQLVHDSLDPSLRVYVEWSNEVWNGSFPQNAYSATQAMSLGLAGNTPAVSYQVYQSVRVFEAFEAVFGKGSPRLVKVIAEQAAWTGPCTDAVTAFGDATINPNGTKADAYAIAPYFSGNTIADLTTAVTTAVGWAQSSYTCGMTAGLPLISYEGGADSFSAPNNGCTTIQHDAGMHDLYMQYLTGLRGANLSGPFMQYTHAGSCWGLKEKTTDALADSPKYAGVLDWLKANP